ncbi:MAG: hypothetical protein AAGI52_10345 [Bacteroidota bacterium]
MLRLVLSAALLLSLAACSSSRGPDLRSEAAIPGADSTAIAPADPVAELDERLDLTEDQERSVRRALDAYREALVVARRQTDIRSRQVERERARFEADARIIAALTGEQREIFEEIRAEREASVDPLVRQRLAQLTRRLDLTEDQQDAIAPLLVDQVEQLELVVSRFRRTGGDREAAQAELDAIRAETDTEILRLLTDEQFLIYQQIIEERGDRRRARR